MTRAAWPNNSNHRLNGRWRTGSNMCWRDRAIRRVVSDEANERLVCSLTIRKVFVLTLSFQAKDDLILKLENVAFAM